MQIFRRSLRNIRKDQRGQTIIEVIIATGIVALVMTAIVSVVTVSVINTVQAKSRVLATKYAQEGMEVFRRQRSLLGWETFVQTMETDGTVIEYCLPTIPATTAEFTALTNAPCGTDDYITLPNGEEIFKRQAEVTITQAGAVTQVLIQVSVTWVDGDKERSSQLGQKFEEWSIVDVPVAPSPSPGAPPPPSPGQDPSPSPSQGGGPPAKSSWTATASQTYQTFVPANAHDGNNSTYWNSNALPPQWLEINFGQASTVTSLQLLITQSPNGNTVHQVYAGANSDPATLVHTFSGSTTNLQTLSTTFDPPLQNIQYIRIYTTTSPSAVAWVEVTAN